jgi:N-acetylglucosamine-6-phosphate deacetylase
MKRPRATRRLSIHARSLVFPGAAAREGVVVVEGDRVSRLTSGSGRAVDIVAPGGAVGPGFVDLQINGAAGCDFLSPTEDGLAAAEAYLLSTGTVAYLPTLISAPEEQTRAALAFFAARMRGRAPRILGVHLEGPFLSPARAGAHRPEHFRTPSMEWIGRLLDDFQGVVRLVTLAPELPGALDVTAYLRRRRVRVAVGHTDATYEQACAAFDHGATLATHLYNAMRPFHHREPGVVGAALDHPGVVCSVIADLTHLHPATLAQAMAVKGASGTALITDAIAAAGARGGGLTLGDQPIKVEDGVPRLANGTLAGSVLAMDQAVRNVIGLRHDLRFVWQMASQTPRDILGIAQGTRSKMPADLVVLDNRHRVMATIVRGQIVWTR